MTTTPLTDQQLADSHLLDLIQDEVDSKPPHYYRFNGGLYVPKVLPLAQALRADRDRLAAELGRVRTELATARAAAFREAARVLEHTGRDDDAVNLLDNIADGITAPAAAVPSA